MKVFLTGINAGQVISKADAATLLDRFQTELGKFSAFEVVAAVADADLTFSVAISRQEPLYVIKVEIRAIKSGKSAAEEKSYSTSTDLILDFTKDLPDLVRNRLEPTARNLMPPVASGVPPGTTKPSNGNSRKVLYIVMATVVAGGGGAAVWWWWIHRPGAISLTIPVP